ncbi:hypothetical protein SELA5_p0030 (plasmid) [Salmonella enterica subsp. enterica serovar Enteritidis str. LA5]|nr:hypothetical protein SELA5_p0030 [Salmonella enterica subsp. enterica serovar Enteritidis str. LA5]
MRRTAVRRVI